MIACVWTGTKYPVTYVTRLFSMVARHITVPFTPVCLTDHKKHELPAGITYVDVRELKLTGWWAKLALLKPAWRAGRRVIYMDLDTVIVGDITPLTQLDGAFYVPRNFARIASPDYPCLYGSCVQIIGADALPDAWDRFVERRKELIEKAGQFGDQKVLELIIPDAPALQDHVPAGFFMDRRELVKHPKTKPRSARIVVFAGPLRPANCKIPWVQEAWR